MKKLLLLFFFITAGYFVKGQKVPTPFPLYNVFSYEIDNYTSGSRTSDTTLISYTYDSIHRLKTRTDYKRVKGSWQAATLKSCRYDSGGAYMYAETSNYDAAKKQFIPQSATSARYDSAGRAIYYFSATYNGSKFVFTQFNNYVYDSLGRLANYTIHDTAHKTGIREYYRYNKSGSKIADSLLNWDDKKGEWYNVTLEYWQKNNFAQDTADIVQAGKANTWVNKTKNIITYDTSHRVKLNISLSWDVNKSLWDSTELDSTVDSIGQWKVYANSWIGTPIHWEPQSLIINTGTNKDYCSSYERWDSAMNAYNTFIDVDPICYDYDGYGNPASRYSGYWGSFSYLDEEWRYDSIERLKFHHYMSGSNISETDYYYYPNTYTGNEVLNAAPFHISVYPNPSNGKYSVSLPQDFSGTVEVYDLLGKVVYRQRTDKNIMQLQIDAPPGMYLLKIIDNNGLSEIKKIMKY